MNATRTDPGSTARRRVELIYFAGCPNVAAARTNLRAALEAQGTPCDVREWTQGDPAAPDYVRDRASPTVLVDGQDVSGEASGRGASCRAAGAPTVEEIRRALGPS